ncbi:MAG: hypothetical protein ACRESZ_11625, partial [Methylococcales bacterium]
PESDKLMGSKVSPLPDLISKILQPGRHTGRQIAGIQSTWMYLGCRPWRLGSGNPCRNDGFFGL